MGQDLSHALNYALRHGMQIHPEAFKILAGVESGRLEKIMRDVVRESAKKRACQITRDDLEAYLGIKDDPLLEGRVVVLSDPTGRTATGEGVDGYGALFASRFEKLRRIIGARPEARMIRTVSATKSSKADDDIFVCGLFVERFAGQSMTKMCLEDPTGMVELAVFDPELQRMVDTLLADQLVMARVGHGKSSGLVAKDLVLPDVPERQGGRAADDVYAVLISDLHIGSRYFMEKEFESLVSWVSSPDPVAKKVRFVLVCGDVVDGVGIYPDQDRELVSQTVAGQLAVFEEFISKIPTNIKIVVAPGNHDPGRRALPQPAIPSKYNEGLWKRDNVVMVGNPSVVSLNGVKVLMFHGQSIDDVVKITPGLEYDRPATVMKQLLRARHLSPIYGSQTPIAPESEDLMVIDDVPDIFHAGHVHKIEVDMYRGVLVVNSGCWQRQTPFQSSVGIIPNCGIGIVVNLKTFAVNKLDCTSEDVG